MQPVFTVFPQLCIIICLTIIVMNLVGLESRLLLDTVSIDVFALCFVLFSYNDGFCTAGV